MHAFNQKVKSQKLNVFIVNFPESGWKFQMVMIHLGYCTGHFQKSVMNLQVICWSNIHELSNHEDPVVTVVWFGHCHLHIYPWFLLFGMPINIWHYGWILPIWQSWYTVTFYNISTYTLTHFGYQGMHNYLNINLQCYQQKRTSNSLSRWLSKSINILFFLIMQCRLIIDYLQLLVNIQDAGNLQRIWEIEVNQRRLLCKYRES